MADANGGLLPVLGENGEPMRQDQPPTITGMLGDAAKPQPVPGTALGWFMKDHELADAGIPVTVINGADLGKPVASIASSKDSGVPETPPGVSVDDNMRRAEQMRDTIMDGMSGDMPPADPAYGIMTAWFPKGHEMDYKKGGDQYQDFGNFNYGAVGSRLGIGPYMLHGAAGVAQIMDGHQNSGIGYPFLTGLSGDSKQDYDQIDRGIAYERAHGGR